MRKSFQFINDKDRTGFYYLKIMVPNFGFRTEEPFKDSHKVYLENLLFKLESIYQVDLICYCVTGSGVHLIIEHNSHAVKIPLKETALRYQNNYSLKETPDARSKEVHKFRGRLNKTSEFMRDLQRRFTFWYNKTTGRHGSLWSPRYKRNLLLTLESLVESMKYVELCPVRENVVQSPGEYEFSSRGHIYKEDNRGTYLKKRIIDSIQVFDRKLSAEEAVEYYFRDL